MNPTRPMSEDHMRTGPEVICEAVEDIILLHGVPTVEIGTTSMRRSSALPSTDRPGMT